MAAPHDRDGRRLTTAPAETGGRFCTYADRNEARVYRELAGKARVAGYKISASQVRRWVMDELLPSPGRRVSLGRAGTRTERDESVEGQLLAVCEFRGLTKSWDRLATLLWANGWRVPTERYRRAVLAELPRIPDPNSLSDEHPRTLQGRDPKSLSEEELDELDRAAGTVAPTYRHLLNRQDRWLAADATSAVFAMALGTTESTSREVADALDRAAVADLVPSPVGSEHDAVAELERLRQAFSIEKVRRMLEQATVDELEASRMRVRVLLQTVPPRFRDSRGDTGDALRRPWAGQCP